MTYKLKKDHLDNWNVQQPNEKPTFNDDQDSYISERSSTISLNDNSPSPKSNNKHVSPPIPQKDTHDRRYYDNELPENGIPLATQDKRKQKNIRKAPPGQGNLVPFPEIKPPEMSDKYYPYWYYYKVKNPDWIMRHRQTRDGQLIPYESVDPSQYAHQPALTTLARKSHRKSRRDSLIMQYNPDKKRHKPVRTDSLPAFRENSNQQRSSSNQYIAIKDADNRERSNQFSTQIRPPPQQGSKLKTENDWNDHYIQSITKSKSSQDSNNLTSNFDTSRHHHSKKMHNILPDKNRKYHHHSSQSHHHHHHHSSHSQHHHHSSQSQHQHHHHHHHSTPPPQSQPHHHHHHHHSPTKEYVDSEFQVIDASFKKSERTPYFQQTQNPFHLPPPNIYDQSSYLPPPAIYDQSSYLPPPAIYDQSSYLPPITHDYYNRPNPIDYYSRQTFYTDRKDSIRSPEIYKADPQTNFYDRYLITIISKKVT